MALSDKPVLLVDDDDLLRDVVRRALTRLLPNPVFAFGNGNEAVEWAQANRPAVAVLDVDMSPMNGIAVAVALLERWPDLPIVFLTGSADDHVHEEAATLRPVAILAKPVSVGNVADTIRSALGSAV